MLSHISNPLCLRDLGIAGSLAAERSCCQEQLVASHILVRDHAWLSWGLRISTDQGAWRRRRLFVRMKDAGGGLHDLFWVFGIRKSMKKPYIIGPLRPETSELECFKAGHEVVPLWTRRAVGGLFCVGHLGCGNSA